MDLMWQNVYTLLEKGDEVAVTVLERDDPHVHLISPYQHVIGLGAPALTHRIQ